MSDTGRCLHILSRLPEHAGFDQCLYYLEPGDGLLLIEDAVIIATRPDFMNKCLLATDALWCLSPDLAARGLSGYWLPEFSQVDYPEFVALTLEFDKVRTWL